MSEDLIPSQVITIVALLGGLVCIYSSSINIIGGFCSILAIVLSSVYGSNTLRKIGEYSLGTGIPSIVYMLLSVALVGYIFAITVSSYLNLTIIYPVLSILVSALLAYILSLVCKHVFKIRIGTLSKSFVSLAVSGVLMIISMSTFVAQSFDVNLIYQTTIENGLIILIMFCAVMIIQNPYNSCMGPNEDQYRTLSLAVSITFLLLMVFSVITYLNSTYWIFYLLISLMGWLFFFRKYVLYTKHQVASIKHGGLWTTGDGG